MKALLPLTGQGISPVYHPCKPSRMPSISCRSVCSFWSHSLSWLMADSQQALAKGARHLITCVLSSRPWPHCRHWLAVRNLHHLMFSPCAKSPLASLVTHLHCYHPTSIIALRTDSQSTELAVPPNLPVHNQCLQSLPPLICSQSVRFHCLIIFCVLM